MVTNTATVVHNAYDVLTVQMVHRIMHYNNKKKELI